MSEYTKGEWEKVIYATDELKPLTTKARYLEFCERCWDLTQKHGDAQKDFWGVRRADKNEDETVIIALCGNGPDGRANARLIAAAPDLLEVCEQAVELLETCDRHFGTHTINTRESVEAAIAKAKKQ